MYRKLPRRIALLGSTVVIAMLSAFLPFESASAASGSVLKAAPQQATSQMARFTTGPQRLELRYRRADGSRVDPPDACWSSAGLTVDATYVNGVLAATSTDFSGDVFCDAPNPNQTMEFLAVHSVLFDQTHQLADAGWDRCSLNNPDPVCRVVFAGDLYVCGGPGCAGYYSTTAWTELLLPAGWEWSGTPVGCSLNGPRDLFCTVSAGPIYIPPTPTPRT